MTAQLGSGHLFTEESREVHRSLDSFGQGKMINEVAEEKIEPKNPAEKLGEVAHNSSKKNLCIN